MLPAIAIAVDCAILNRSPFVITRISRAASSGFEAMK
jgi:hypothetical protein